MMASVGYSAQNDLPSAELHTRKALEIARQQKSAEHQAECLGVLGGLIKRQGRLSEALAIAQRALALSRSSRNAAVLQIETLADMGRFDEARQAIETALALPSATTNEYNAYSHALNYFSLAYLEAADEKPEAGLAALQQARKVLTDPKIRLWIDALEATLLAQQGLSEPSRRLSEQSENALMNFENDVQTQRNVLSQLGRAALARGDWANCRQFYEKYFQFNPLPVDSCAAFYRLGDCARGEGKMEEARCFYEKAVVDKFETHQCQRAQQRLDELNI